MKVAPPATPIKPAKRRVSTRPKQPAQRMGVCQLAAFRYHLRKFLRFSEQAARAHGVTPQQHQLMLGIAGYTGRGCATLSELAEFLQEQHNSVVGLVERAVERGLVRKKPDTQDRRRVVVTLTRRGEKILSNLSALHHEEIQRMQSWLLLPTENAASSKKIPRLIKRTGTR